MSTMKGEVSYGGMFRFKRVVSWGFGRELLS